MEKTKKVQLVDIGDSFDKDRIDKTVFKGDVSDFPNYRYLGFGSILLLF